MRGGRWGKGVARGRKWDRVGQVLEALTLAVQALSMAESCSGGAPHCPVCGKEGFGTHYPYCLLERARTSCAALISEIEADHAQA